MSYTTARMNAPTAKAYDLITRSLFLVNSATNTLSEGGYNALDDWFTGLFGRDLARGVDFYELSNYFEW